MRITIAGLGYVGTVSAACLADAGHSVSVVDINQTKIATLNAGESPIVEAGLAEIVARTVANGALRATDDLSGSTAASDVTMVCVGTPTGSNGDVDLTDVMTVTEQVGHALREVPGWHLVMICSSVPPGTVDNDILPMLEKESGRTAGLDFGLAFSPEFLREGSAVADFRSPPKTVIGAADSRSSKTAREVFAPFATNLMETTISTAEAVKFTDNAWHALKVTFANEIGRICDAFGVDSHAVMDVFKSDHRLNISSAYLTPGFAFGGSCLPKDVRTLTYRARAAGVNVPVLDAVLPSNRAHIELALRKIEAAGERTIAILGLAFKAGTDDLRESPSLELAERLLGRGYQLRIHDDYVSPSRLVGANRAYALKHLPHIASILDDDLDRVLDGAGVVVVTQGSKSYATVTKRLPESLPVIDLTGIARPGAGAERYAGLTW
jgi:GDP-mannose 6-dehydrogenase